MSGTIDLSGTITLFCIVQGDTFDRLFSVRMNRKDTVVSMKAAIHSKKPEIDARTLQLWKVDLPFAGITAHTVNCLNLKDNEQLSPSTLISELWPHPAIHTLNVVLKRPSTTITPNLNLFSNINFSNSAAVECKRKREPTRDVTEELHTRWLTSLQSLPSSFSALESYLLTPLKDDEKVPISRSILKPLVSKGDVECSERDLEALFRVTEEEEVDDLLSFMVAVDRLPPPMDGLKRSFIHFWDDNIRMLLEQVFNSGIAVRDGNQGEIAGLDLAFLINNLCVFRGGEGNMSTDPDPREELWDKLDWTYDPAPYILGYYAVGPYVTLVAISPSGVEDLSTTNLTTKKGRIQHIVKMIKLYSVLRLLSEIISNHDNFLVVERPRDVTITIRDRCISKSYTSQDRKNRIVRIQSIYSILERKRVPNVDRIVMVYQDHPKHGSTIFLQPNGEKRLPHRASGMIEAAICVLQALKVMHAEPALFHRDINWSNVLWNQRNQSWFLTDFDDASMAPTRAVPHLSTDHHSNVFLDSHGAEVDIWAVGKLILNAAEVVVDVSEELRSAGRAMVQGPMTAEQALTRLRKLHADALGRLVA